VCNVQTTCVRPGALDSACSDASPCALGLTCFKSKCVAAPGQGAPCDLTGVTNPTCDLTQALFCDPTARSCKQATFGKDGDACGLVNGTFQACRGTTYCNAKPLENGTCRAKAADGAACSSDVTKGAPCLTPAVCVAGTCTLGDPATCR
jgi:hypothetical protein